MKKKSRCNMDEMREAFINGNISADQLIKARLALKDTTEVLEGIANRLMRNGITVNGKGSDTSV